MVYHSRLGVQYNSKEEDGLKKSSIITVNSQFIDFNNSSHLIF